MKMLSKKKVVCCLAVICFIQLVVSIFFASKKQYLFIDELYSYASANNEEGAIIEMPSHQWLDEQWYEEYVDAQDGARFDFSIPYRNQDSDVHPPLFYIFLHMASSVTQNIESYGAGLGLNIFLFICCTIGMYFLGKEIFSSQICGFLSAFLFGINFGGLNTMTFIRMYMLLALVVVVHAFVYIRYFEQEEPQWNGYLYLALTLVFGVLTQYYFLFAAFFFGLWYTIKFLFKKQYMKLGKYLTTIVSSAGMSLLIYPMMWKHIFNSGRGTEAQGNFFVWDGYLEKCKVLIGIIDNQLFTKLLPVLLVGMLVLFGVGLIRKKEMNREIVYKALTILFVCTGYVLIVAKVAPYQVDRYLMPIYPLVYVVAVGSTFQLMQNLFSKRIAGILCLLGFAGLSFVHLLYSELPYTYARNENVNSRLEIAEEYQDCYALYIDEVEDDIARYYDVLQVLKEYKGFYYINNMDLLRQSEADCQILVPELPIIIYVSHSENDKIEKIYQTINEMWPERDMNEKCLVNRDEKWDVYCVQ